MLSRTGMRAKVKLNWGESSISAKGNRQQPSASGIDAPMHWRARVRNWLPLDHALALSDALQQPQFPWEWVFMDGKSVTTMASTRVAVMARSQVSALWRTIHAQANDQFQFSYRKYSLVDAARRGAPMHPALADFLGCIASKDAIEAVRALSAADDIKQVDAQPTRYEPGDFLTVHTDDQDAHFTRRVAYVYSLCQGWKPDWGGLLHFHGDAGEIVETFVPEFNTLSLFTVPQAHSVSAVAPFAGAPRHSITGWFTASDSNPETR